MVIYYIITTYHAMSTKIPITLTAASTDAIINRLNRVIKYGSEYAIFNPELFHTVGERGIICHAITGEIFHPSHRRGSRFEHIYFCVAVCDGKSEIHEPRYLYFNSPEEFDRSVKGHHTDDYIVKNWHNRSQCVNKSKDSTTATSSALTYHTSIFPSLTNENSTKTMNIIVRQYYTDTQTQVAPTQYTIQPEVNTKYLPSMKTPTLLNDVTLHPSMQFSGICGY